MNILLAGTGSVATIKYWRLMKALKELGDVKGILTTAAEFFAKKALTQDVLDDDLVDSLVTEQDEWNWHEVGDPVHHIDLKDWADVLVIAPLTANTLTKMSVGIVDNLLTSVYYAWPMDKNIVLAPAMNTDMWNNPLTRKHLQELQDRHHFTRYPIDKEMSCDPNRGFYNFDSKAYRSLEDGVLGYRVHERRLHVVEPVESKLACGVVGKGAMAPLSDIVKAVKAYGE